MGTNWIRHFKLTCEGSRGAIDLSEMRCRFSVKQWSTETTNNADVRVTNLAPKTIKPFLDREYTKVTIEAGYQDCYGVVYKGEIVQARSGRESPTDTYLDIFASDGATSHNYAVVNKSFAAGSTPKDHYDEALKAMKQFGAQPGFVGVDLSKPKYPRPVILYGMAREVLRNIAHSKDALWSTQNGEVQMVGVKQTLPGGAIKLNSMTGLIGMPTQEITGIMARVLINPSIKVNSKVHIDQASIQRAAWIRDVGGGVENPQNAILPSVAADGFYKVLKIDIIGDTRGTPWYMDLACVAASGEGWLPAKVAVYQGTE